MNIGTKIRILRTENKDTLRSLAEKIEYNLSNLSKIERGKIEVSIDLLQRIINVYDVDANYFFDNGKRLVIEGIEATDEEITEAVKLIRFLRRNG